MKHVTVIALAIFFAATACRTGQAGPTSSTATPGGSAAATAQAAAEPTALPTFTAVVVGGTEPEPGITALTTLGDEVWIAIGTAIVATDDGGTTWSKLGAVDSPANALSFTSPRDGWAATDGGLLSTIDGGLTWLQVKGLPPGKAARVRFANPTHGWVTTGDGGLQRTMDGGHTWAAVARACANGLYAFSDADVGWTLCPGQASAGEQAKDLFATKDGGASWSLFSHGSAFQDPARAPSPFVLPDGGYATDLFFLDGQVGWIAAERAGLYATVDGGKNWDVVPLKGLAEPAAEGVNFATPLRGYVIAEGAVWRTDDAGRTLSRIWGMAPGPLPTVDAADSRLIPGYLIYAVARIDNAHIWVVADRCRNVYRPELQQKIGRSTVMECENRPHLLRTEDGGQHWTAYDLPGVVPDDIWAADAKHLVANDHSAFYVSSDGGATWIRSHPDLLTGKQPAFAD